MKNVEYLSTREAGSYIKPKVSPSRVRAMDRQGKFPDSFLLGGRRFIPIKNLDAENKRRERL